MSTSIRTTLVLAAALCADMTAQQLNDAGFGAVKSSFNASTQTQPFDNLVSGIAYVNGLVYTGTNAAPPVIYVYNQGRLTRTFATPMAPAGGTFDMDTDGSLIFATSAAGGIIVFDPTTGGTTGLSVAARNGPQALARNPIPTTLPNLHSVAYNPNGNGGKGSLYIGAKIPSTVTNNAPIVEIDLAGAVLNTFQNTAATRHDASGLTYDPRTGNLWCMTEANSLDIIELDAKNNMQPTGVRFQQGLPSMQWLGRCCGGICGIPGGDRNTYPSDFDMAVLTRLFGDDYAFIHRIHLFPGRRGYEEARMEGSVNSTTLGQGVANDGNLGGIKASDTLRWRVDAGTSKSNGLPQVTLIAVGPDAALDGTTALFPELRVLSPFSVPQSPFTLMLFGTVGAPALSATVPGGVLDCFELVRFQALYLDTVAPGPFQLVATNEIWANWSNEAGCTVVVEAVGTNSANNVTTSGFFRVIHKGGLPITEVTFDWFECRDPAQAPAAFDVDQTGMADVFDAGNSTSATCRGTYRNGCDVTTGLVYDNLNRPANACASAGANSGFIADNGTNNGDGSNVKTIRFRFANAKFVGSSASPMVFEFDCDTDGAVGVDGASMAGMVITVKFLGGIVRKGELRADLTAPVSRSVTGF